MEYPRTARNNRDHSDMPVVLHSAPCDLHQDSIVLFWECLWARPSRKRSSSKSEELFSEGNVIFLPHCSRWTSFTRSAQLNSSHSLYATRREGRDRPNSDQCGGLAIQEPICEPVQPEDSAKESHNPKDYDDGPDNGCQGVH